LIVKLSFSSNVPASNALHFNSPSFKDAAPELSNLQSSEPLAQFLKRFCLLLSNHPRAVNNIKIKSNGNQRSPCNILFEL